MRPGRIEDGLLLAASSGQLHLFNFASGESVAFDHPGGSMHVIPSGEGFAVVTEDATSSTCRLARYEWTATTVTDVSFACIRLHGLGGAGVHLSPDGRWIAALTRMLAGDVPIVGDSPAAIELSILDAATGAEALRVGGALFLGEVLIAGATPWLADSSGLVVGTVAGVQIVDLEDGWAPSPPALSSSTWVLPAPDDASRITLGGQHCCRPGREHSRQGECRTGRVLEQLRAALARSCASRHSRMPAVGSASGSA